MRQNQQIFILLLICICTFFVHLDTAFPDLMEMRNFITAREMITEGNWWFTTLNLEPRLEKPPLPTWLTAWSVSLLGDFDNLFALRLPGAIIATLMVFFFYGFLKEYSNKTYLPFIGASILATSILVVQAGRTNSWDIYTHAFMVGSLWQFLVGIKKSKRWPIFFSMVLMGLSVFSKGPVSVYALWLPYVIALGISFKDELKQHWGKLLFILLGGLVIGFAWNFYMYLFQPEATEYVLNKETNSWINRHVKSVIFYLNFPIFLGIWIPFLVPFFFYKYAQKKSESVKHYQFVLLWLVAIIVLLSLVPTKKERYVLPALIPMSLAVAYIVQSLYKTLKIEYSKYDKLVIRIVFYLLTIACIVGPIVLSVLYKDTISMLSIVGFICTGITGIYGLIQLRKQQYKTLFYLPVIVVCCLCVFVTPNVVQWSYHYDEFKNLEEIQQIQKLQPYPVVYTENMHTDPKICWLVGKPTKLIADVDFTQPDKFPLVAVTVNPLEDLYPNGGLGNITYEYFGEYDYYRRKSKWRAQVYLLEWKN